jgi:S1-C subfamily serine protease
MSEPATPPEKSSQQSNKDDKDKDALIVTPISIARARHASAHGDSVLAKTRGHSAAPQKKAVAQSKSATTGTPAPAAANGSGFFSSSSSCLLVSLLSIAFVVGGVLGGIIGGGLLLWANSAEGVVFMSSTPTPTPPPTPTPVPVETSTPTPTPEPIATPSIEDIIASVIPSVVTVVNQQHNGFSSTTLDEGRVVGSGVVIDSRGYVVTNNHVVDAPGELNVILPDGREILAELVAANPAEDLALLKIGISDLPAITWGDSSKVRPGQMVYAIGSPLGDFPSSVSFGIVSGLNRALEIDKYVIDGLIQTDAAINRGSSGGPLINLRGDVIGINTFIIRESEERGIAEGIAFSIPAKTAKNLLIPWMAAHTGESVPIPASEESDK